MALVAARAGRMALACKSCSTLIQSSAAAYGRISAFLQLSLRAPAACLLLLLRILTMILG